MTYEEDNVANMRGWKESSQTNVVLRIVVNKKLYLAWKIHRRDSNGI